MSHDTKSEGAGLPPLPPGWAWTRVDEVGEVKLGRQRSPEHHHGPHMRPYLRVANVFEGRIDLSDVLEMNFTPEEYETYRLRYGDVLLNEGQSLELVGRPALYREELPGACFQNTLVRFRPGPAVEPAFALAVFRHYLHSKRFQRLARWTVNIAHLGAGRFAEVEFPLPPPPEQRRIVARLDELSSDLDAGVAALERVRANLKRYRAAVLKAAVEGALTEERRAAHPDTEPASQLLERLLVERRRRWEADQRTKFSGVGKAPPQGWQSRYPEPTRPDTSLLPPLPPGWCWASVEQVADVQGGIQKHPKRRPGNNAYPYLRVANVLRDQLDLREVLTIELFGDELGRLRLREGDLLVVEGNGSRTEIGRSAVWRGEVPDCVHQNHIVRVRFLAGLPAYLNAYWNSPQGRQRAMAKAASTSGLYTLSAAKVSQLPVPLPPLAEQEAIVAEVEQRLSVIAALDDYIEASIKRAGRLRQSILKEAFAGRLVPQDPADEPAGELLRRIARGESTTRIKRAGGDGRPRRRNPADQRSQPMTPDPGGR